MAKEFYIQHGQWGGPYRTEKAESVKITEAPRFYSASGYGSKIPTQYMVRYRGKWRRVYVMCFSNSGTAWINCDGERTVVHDYDVEA